jgi:hypothetical protein
LDQLLQKRLLLIIETIAFLFLILPQNKSCVCVSM